MLPNLLPSIFQGLKSPKELIFENMMALVNFQFQKDDVENGEETPYGYGFFHFVFCLGAMHFAMIFIGWDMAQTSQQ
jgi:hypothetical protein